MTKSLFRQNKSENYREKKREKLNHLLQEAESLEKLNENLRQDCYRLEAEKRYLVKMLMERPTCTPENQFHLAVDASIESFNVTKSESEI